MTAFLEDQFALYIFSLSLLSLQKKQMLFLAMTSVYIVDAINSIDITISSHDMASYTGFSFQNLLLTSSIGKIHDNRNVIIVTFPNIIAKKH